MKKSIKKQYKNARAKEKTNSGMNVFEAVKLGFKYGFSFQRIMLFFILLLPFIIIFIVYHNEIIIYGSQILKMQPDSVVNNEAMSNLRTPAMWTFIFFAVAALLQILVKGIISNNAVAKKNLMKSLAEVLPNYFSLISATIIVLLFSIVASALTLVPFAGAFLYNLAALFLALVFMFYVQSISIAGRAVFASLSESYNIFIKNPVDVILLTLYVMILSVVFFIIAFIPIVAAGFSVFSYIFNNLSNPDYSVVANLVDKNIMIISIGLVISSFLVSYISVFAEASKAYFYVRITKNEKNK